MILIITDAFDPHADSVINHLPSGSYFRLNLDVESLLRTEVFYEDASWSIKNEHGEVFSNSISCVWARRLHVSLTLEQKTDTESVGFKIWRGEWNRCLFGIYASLRHLFWMNPVQNSALADNKYYQMSIAKKVGFLVPRLITSNKKTTIQEFCETEKECAVKFMAQDIYKTESGDYKGIYVNKININDLDKFDGASENPVTIQKYIEKKFEVRATYVDGEIFSCKIDSQKSEISNVDWRRYDIKNTPHIKIETPSEISFLMHKIMHELGLYYGAFDFIVDNVEKWWYLEVNSAGQWLWIEDLADFPISARIASVLISRINGGSAP